MVINDKPPLPANSDAWKSHLRPWLNRRIEDLRDTLETPGAPADELRGRIAELKELRALVEPDLPDVAAPGYFPPGQRPS